MIAVPCGASYLFAVTSGTVSAMRKKQKNVVREMLELHVFKRQESSKALLYKKAMH